jgi:hypothetical protein
VIEEETTFYQEASYVSASVIEMNNIEELGTWNDVVTSNSQGAQQVVHRIISKLRQGYLCSCDDLSHFFRVRERWPV